MANNELIPFTVGGRPAGMRLAEFRNDSDEPLPSHKLWIENFFIPVMAKNPAARLRLIGMASRNGDANYNMGLSKRRIDKVEAFIRSKGSKVLIIERNPRGEIQAKEDGFDDGDRSGRYRAVLLQWEGLSGPAPLPGPGPTPTKFKKVRIKADKGVWLIVGVDTFGLPIKSGVTAGKIAVTLLNDQGELWRINGLGIGIGVGPDLKIDHLKAVVQKAIELGMKLGDIPNVLPEDLKNALPEALTASATAGGIFKRGSIVSNFTIEDFKRENQMTVSSGGIGVVAAAGELGAIFFGADSPLISVPSGRPWGVYSSLGVLKLALEVGIMRYAISVESRGVLEKEVLDI